MKSITIITVTIIGVLLTSVHGCNGAPPESGTAKIAVTSDKAVTIHEDFDADLKDWEFVEGTWEPGTSDGNGVLVQTAIDRVFPVALWKKSRFSDVEVTVRFKPISGQIDASGGIIFRARDGRNYYIVRANSLEDNFRLYTVIDGQRRQIASTNIEAPALGQWHTLRIVVDGPHIQAYLNDELLINHQDETFKVGWVGLWTKADAVTEFDDLLVKGVPPMKE